MKKFFRNGCHLVRMYVRCLRKYHKCGRRRIILMNTPLHGNTGDQAIALAEMMFLKKYFPEYSLCEIDSDDLIGNFKIWKRLIKKEDTIMVHGGGYLGDLWLNEEIKFRRILENFTGNKIIVFPQSMYYKNEAEIPKSEKAYKKYACIGKHKLVVLLRDKYSYDFFNAHFSKFAESYLVPDIVLFMKFEKNSARSGALVCFRKDGEECREEERYRKTAIDLVKKTFEKVEFTDTCVGARIPIDMRKNSVEQKLQQFSSAELVITDRLHGMFFAAITGTPCIAFDNVSGKVSGGYQWISDLPYIKQIQKDTDFEEVFETIKKNLRKAYFFDSKWLQEEFNKMFQIIRKEIESSEG